MDLLFFRVFSTDGGIVFSFYPFGWAQIYLKFWLLHVPVVVHHKIHSNNKSTNHKNNVVSQIAVMHNNVGMYKLSVLF